MKNLYSPKNIWLCLSLILLVPVIGIAAEAAIQNISAEMSADLIEKYRSNPDFVILDIRTPAEFEAGHISGAHMLDFYSKSFANDFSRLDPGKIYLIYCRSGNRSGQLMKAIRELGFEMIYNMELGLVDWVGQGYELTTS
ncbi:MAG: rhodanese-like domain-containing protein [Deltaproteobacteria bacterium]|nr:rhodanese-like domain-containing protein [Deltaproteobacteria bacterium]